MDAQVRTFQHASYKEDVEIRFHTSGPFLYVTILRPEYDGVWYGEKGLVHPKKLGEILDALKHQCMFEMPVLNRAVVRRDGDDGDLTHHYGFDCDTLTVDADDPYLRTWFLEMLLLYKEALG